MNTSTDKNLALQFLRGLDQGGIDTDKARNLAEELDPVLLYMIVRYLRETYPASDPVASPVLDRVVQLSSAYPSMVAKSKEGEEDPVSEWFSSEYSFRDFRGRGDEMVALIVDKLET
jgi:hypothetical protein